MTATTFWAETPEEKQRCWWYCQGKKNYLQRSCRGNPSMNLLCPLLGALEDPASCSRCSDASFIPLLGGVQTLDHILQVVPAGEHTRVASKSLDCKQVTGMTYEQLRPFISPPCPKMLLPFLPPPGLPSDATLHIEVSEISDIQHLHKPQGGKSASLGAMGVEVSTARQQGKKTVPILEGEGCG